MDKTKEVKNCPFERIRSYPDCYEDCPDTDSCPERIEPKPISNPVNVSPSVFEPDKIKSIDAFEEDTMGEQKPKEGLSIPSLWFSEPKPDKSRLVEEHNMLLQTQNSGKVIVDTTPALKLQDAKTTSIKDAEIAELNESIEYLVEACEVITDYMESECQARMEKKMTVGEMFKEIDEHFEKYGFQSEEQRNWWYRTAHPL